MVLLAVIVAIWFAARPFGAGRKLADLRDWMNSLGPVGPIVFVVVRASAAVAVLPGSPLSAVAGALFGSVIGIVCVSAAKTLAACLSFLIARHFAREAVAQWLSTNEKVRQLDELVAEHGALIVAAARLFPVIPTSVQNYGFGLTRVRFSTYLIWSFLCMLPGSVLVVVAADVTVETLSEWQVPWACVIVLASTVVVMVGLATYTLLKVRASTNAHRRDHS